MKVPPVFFTVTTLLLASLPEFSQAEVKHKDAVIDEIDITSTWY